MGEELGDRGAVGPVAAGEADVVIGSRLVQLLEAEPRERVAAAGRAFIASIREALDEQAQQGVRA